MEEAQLNNTVVMKFGGTSVAGPARIKHVAEIIKRFKETNPTTSVIAVVSAMAGETDRLLELAKVTCENPSGREIDVLLSTGEQVTIALLSMALLERGIDASSLLGSQVRIITKGNYSAAFVSSVETTQLEVLIQKNKVAVVAGFQGVDDMGNITTLGRGGSDISAVAIAAAIKAKACYIYTDVRGVFSTDPRVCKGAKLLQRISHEEMLELASLGAKVLHPRSVFFAMRYKVPLAVLSTFDGDFIEGVNGTWIVPEEDYMEQPLVSGIAHRLDEAKVTVSGLPSGTKSMARLFEVLGASGIATDMITRIPDSDTTVTVCFTVPDENSAEALSAVRGIIPELGAKGVSIERDTAKISIVGAGIRYHADVASRMFSVLSKNDIDVQLVGTSEIKLSVLVPRKYHELALRALHYEFVEHSSEENPPN